jgi:hypothetical protein
MTVFSGLIDEHGIESMAPGLREGTEVRHIDLESIVWSASGTGPAFLDAVGTVVVQLLDGQTTLAELADEIHDEVGIPRSIAMAQLRTVVEQLHSVGALNTNANSPQPARDVGLFAGPPNP